MRRHVADIHGVLSLIRATHGRKESRKNELTALLRAASQDPLISTRAPLPPSLSLARSLARSPFFLRAAETSEHTARVTSVAIRL